MMGAVVLEALRGGGEDFRADKPPARKPAHTSAPGAVLCASIRATPESRFHTRRVSRRHGSQVSMTHPGPGSLVATAGAT